MRNKLEVIVRLSAGILFWPGAIVHAQELDLPPALSSPQYEAFETVTNCMGAAPPANCTGVTLSSNANVTLVAGSQIILGPGFTANAINASTSLVARIATTVVTTSASDLNACINSSGTDLLICELAPSSVPYQVYTTLYVGRSNTIITGRHHFGSSELLADEQRYDGCE